MENMLKLFGFVGNRISNVIRNANNDGPPDLDELVKDLKSKVNNVFKLKPKNTNNGQSQQLRPGPWGRTKRGVILSDKETIP